jgi:hypothetical protein
MRVCPSFARYVHKLPLGTGAWACASSRRARSLQTMRTGRSAPIRQSCAPSYRADRVCGISRFRAATMGSRAHPVRNGPGPLRKERASSLERASVRRSQRIATRSVPIFPGMCSCPRTNGVASVFLHAAIPMSSSGRPGSHRLHRGRSRCRLEVETARYVSLRGLAPWAI